MKSKDQCMVKVMELVEELKDQGCIEIILRLDDTGENMTVKKAGNERSFGINFE